MRIILPLLSPSVTLSFIQNSHAFNAATQKLNRHESISHHNKLYAFPEQSSSTPSSASWFQKSLEETRKRMNLADGLIEAANDPVKFEKLALKKNSDVNEELSTSTNDEETSTTTEDKKKFVYQRAEDWDREKKNQDKSSMSWEERVQWEGQRQGDKFRQNEILKNHLGI